MKKVILYTSSQLLEIRQTGGVKRFIELVKYLPKYADVILVSGDENYPISGNERHYSMHQTKICSKELKYALHNYTYIRKLKKMNYDAFVVFDVPPAIWLSLMNVPRMTLMLRKDMIEYSKIQMNYDCKKSLCKYIKIKLLTFAETITIFHASKIVVQCEYDKNNLINRHKLLRDNLERKVKIQINNVNPSWANKAVIKPKNDKSTFKIATVNGFADKRKGADIFLEAVASLTDRGYSIEGYIAGDGILLENYKKKYKHYSNIHFFGRISNPSEFICNFDLAVVPSRADSCPNTVLEALYNDVPVIGAKSGGIPEILNAEEYLFLPNAYYLEKKIIQLMDEKYRNEFLKKQNKRKEELRFDWVKCIEKLL